MDTETPMITSVAQMREQMCQLWQMAFGDDREFVLAYFRGYDSPATRIVRYDANGRIVAMMHYHRFSSGGIDGAYVYGLATHPVWRGRGLARQMLQEAFVRMAGEGVQMAMLIAEEESLRSWYAAMGFSLQCGTTVKVTGCDGMNFALDDPAMNVPMIKSIGGFDITDFKVASAITIECVNKADSRWSAPEIPCGG